MENSELRVAEQSMGEADATFEKFHRFRRTGEMIRRNEDGSQAVFQSYEIFVDPAQKRSREALTRFCLEAATAGYRQVFSPITIGPVTYDDDAKTQPVSTVLFVLEKPPRD